MCEGGIRLIDVDSICARNSLTGQDPNIAHPRLVFQAPANFMQSGLRHVDACGTGFISLRMLDWSGFLSRGARSAHRTWQKGRAEDFRQPAFEVRCVYTLDLAVKEANRKTFKPAETGPVKLGGWMHPPGAQPAFAAQGISTTERASRPLPRLRHVSRHQPTSLGIISGGPIGRNNWIFLGISLCLASETFRRARLSNFGQKLWRRSI
jgi:hypothetical protein